MSARDAVDNVGWCQKEPRAEYDARVLAALNRIVDELDSLDRRVRQLEARVA